jgi:hypothetical protein
MVLNVSAPSKQCFGPLILVLKPIEKDVWTTTWTVVTFSDLLLMGKRILKRRSFYFFYEFTGLLWCYIIWNIFLLEKRRGFKNLFLNHLSEIWVERYSVTCNIIGKFLVQSYNWHDNLIHIYKLGLVNSSGWCGEVRDVIFSDGGLVTVIYRVVIRGNDGEVIFYYFLLLFIE